jgi:DUF1680 family protein
MRTIRLIIAAVFTVSLYFLTPMAKSQTTAPAPGNLAIVATASTSFVSQDQTLAALNSGYDPRNSRDASHRAYGNWPRLGTQWVEYSWTQPISTNKIDVYWFADGRGIKLPGQCRLKYWNGTDFVVVPGTQGLGVRGSRYNTTTFPEITTTKLRLEFDSAAKGLDFSTGILQWKVYDSGNSPDFPPLVSAGPDRVVIQTGKTYLAASVKTIKSIAPALAWSKTSGPGDVTFDDSSSAVTTAAFSQPGDYILAMTATTGSLSASGSLHVHVDAPPAQAHLDPVYVSSFQINSQFWNDRIKNLIVNWIPHVYTKLSEPDLKEGGINNFVQAGNKLAGRPFTPRLGPPWADAYTHNCVESMCLALMVDPRGDSDIIAAQKAIRAKLDEWIPIILSAQEPDGYLQTRFTLDPRNPPHWSPRFRTEHEGYTAGYFIESAIADYRLTGGSDMRMFNAAKKLADCWYDHIGPPPKKAWFDGHEEIEHALIRFSVLVDQVEGPGKGDKYVELAKFLMDCRGGGTDYDQSYATATHQYQALGHAVRAAYLYTAMTDLVEQTADVNYQSSVQSIWDNLVNRKYYITGGIGSGETSEGFGEDFSLPNRAYCESCSGCGELFFQHSMNLAYADAKYADLYEQTLFNAVLGDLDLEGKNFYYANPLESPETGGARYPWHDCPCCVGNIPRTLLSLPTWIYSTDADGIYVNLYVGSTMTIKNVAGTDVRIVQTTDYPWNDKAVITLNPSAPAKFAIRLRLPHRDVSALYTSVPSADGISTITINGQQLDPIAMVAGYANLIRTWQPGDKIELTLPLTPQRVTADDRIAADRGRVALRYGPLIYNIEHADQPSLDIPLKSDSPLTTQWMPDLLGGVVAIKGTFADGSPMLAIPNYARCNRGGASIVWLRAQP